MTGMRKIGCAVAALCAHHGDITASAQTVNEEAADAGLLTRLEQRLDEQENRIREQETRLDTQANLILNQALQLELQRQVLSQGSYLGARSNPLYRPPSETYFEPVAWKHMLPAARDGALRSGVTGGRTIPSLNGGFPPIAVSQAPQVSPPSDPPPQGGPEGVPAEPPPTGDATADRPNSEKQVDVLLLDQGGVLLPKGQLFLEPSLDYTSISSDRVNIAGFSVFNAIVIGTIRVDDIDRDIVSAALTARYGILNRLQAEVRVPVVYRLDRELTGVGTGEVEERRTEATEIGDVSATLSWQPIAARGARPATIFRVQADFPTGQSAFQIDRVPVSEDSPEERLVEAPTGSGFFSITPGVTLVWPVDPVVIFAGGGYTYNFSRTFGEFGVVAPGDGFEYLLGMNLSLNDRLSTNFNFTNRRRFSVRQNDVELLGSGTNDARFGWGLSASLNANTSLVLGATLGLTDESPDFSFSIRLPIKF